MAKFAFKLESILQHRLRLEQEAQRALAERIAIAADLEYQLKALNDDLTRATDTLRAGHLVGQIDLTYLGAHRRFIADVNRRRTVLAETLAMARSDAEKARKSLAGAARGRKVLETLREHHLARWRAEQERRCLAQSDEVATSMTSDDLRTEKETPGPTGAPP